MQTIQITQTELLRLQKIATEFADTPASAITRMHDHYEQSHGAKTVVQRPHLLSEQDLPRLRHTKVLDASFGKDRPEKTNWHSLYRLALVSVLKSGQSPHDLHRIAGANVVAGRKETDGYKYVPAHGFSYQGGPAVTAADIVNRCGKFLGVPVNVELEWRNKGRAYRPGERARLQLGKVVR